MMTNNSINVHIYSYKGKSLFDIVKNLFDKSSGDNKIYVQIDDQNPLYRKHMFEEYDNISYNHIFWDHIKSPCDYKIEAIVNTQCDYTLFLSDNIYLPENWDRQLVNNIREESVISGCGKPNLRMNGLFYIDQNRSQTDFFSLSQYVDRDFIFGSTDILKQYIHPNYIKYNGEEEYLSVLYFCNGIDIYSCPSNFYNKINNETIKSLYVPFSINHNYNLIIDLLKDGKNKFTNMWNLDRSIKSFEEYHNISFENIEYLPFQINDVEYDNVNVEFDNIDQRKFMTRTHSIR